MTYAGRKRLGIDVTVTSTTQQHELGLRVELNNGNQYVYIKAGEALTAGNAVKLGALATYQTVLHTTAATTTLVGIVETSIANASYGFICVKGLVANCNLATGVVATDPLVGSGTAGRMAKCAASDVNSATVIALENEAANAGDCYITSGM